MNNSTQSTSKHEVSQASTDCRSTSRNTKKRFLPVFWDKGAGHNTDGIGRRVKGVYLRCGTVYARWRDPATGSEGWVRSPDGSVRGAEAFLSDARRNALGARAFAFSQAVQEHLRPERDVWTIGRALEVYREIAPGHFASISTAHRPRGGGVKHSLWSMNEIFGPALSRPMADAPRVLGDWVEASCRREGRPTPTIVSTARQARSLFARWVLDALEDRGCRVPELRWRELPSPGYQYQLPPQELRERTIAAGKEELAKDSALGRAFLLEFFCAMSAADACRARWDWLRADGAVHYRRHKTGKPADPRLAPEVAARWRELAAADPGDGFVIPGRTEERRLDFIVTTFSKWMRSLGWTGAKTGHELRKLMCSIWYTTPGVGAEWTQAWSGDGLPVLQQYYARLLPERAPEPPSV